jgi:hypothetical protein
VPVSGVGLKKAIHDLCDQLFGIVASVGAIPSGNTEAVWWPPRCEYSLGPEAVEKEGVTILGGFVG